MMQKILIMLGILVLATGILWPWISKLPIGRLPGDINYSKGNFSFHFPLVTCLLLSALLTLILWLFRK